MPFLPWLPLGLGSVPPPPDGERLSPFPSVRQVAVQPAHRLPWRAQPRFGPVPRDTWIPSRPRVFQLISWAPRRVRVIQPQFLRGYLKTTEQPLVVARWRRVRIVHGRLTRNPDRDP